MEIIEIREIDDGWLGETIGYFAKGTHDKQQFAIACNREFELVEYDRAPVCTTQVEHGCLRKVPLPDGGWMLHRSKPGRGAFAATFVM